MATIKSFTDLSQSRNLSKILPIESADMVYIKHATSDNLEFRFDDDMPPMVLKNVPISEINADILPCWSLAALLSVLSDYTLQTSTYGTVFVVCETEKPMVSDDFDNPVDACVGIIEKLHELNLL